MSRAEERLLNPPLGGRIEAARAHGFDLTLLVERLRKTPEERVRDLQHNPRRSGGRARQGVQNLARSGPAHLIDFEQALTGVPSRLNRRGECDSRGELRPHVLGHRRS